MHRKISVDDDAKTNATTESIQEQDEFNQPLPPLPPQTMIDEWRTSLTKENYLSEILHFLLEQSRNKTTEQIQQEIKRLLHWVQNTAFAPAIKLASEVSNNATKTKDQIIEDEKVKEKKMGSLLESLVKLCINRAGAAVKVIFEWNVDPARLEVHVNEMATRLNTEIREYEQQFRSLPNALPDLKNSEVKFARERASMRSEYKEIFRNEYLEVLKTEGKEEIPGGFEMSAQYEKLLEAEKRIANIIVLKIAEDYDTALIAYEDQREMRMKLESQIEELKIRRTACIVAGSITTFCGQYFDSILHSIRTATVGTEVHTKLTGQATIPSTGELVVNPIALDAVNNLPGVYYILEKNYKTANLVVLCENLFRMANFQVSQDDSKHHPEKGVYEMTDIISYWQKLNLIDFLNLDNLATSMLLCGYHPNSEVRTQGVQRVLRTAQRLTDENYVNVPGKMPLFDDLSRYVLDELALGKRLSSKTMSVGTDYSKPRGNYNQNSYFKTSAPKGTESAAAAKVEDDKRDAKGPYQKEVHRSDNLWLKDQESGNYKFRYTATKAPCQKCGTPGQPSCPSPRCFLQQCPNCQLYGHKPRNCLQAKSGATAQVAEETPR